MLFAFVAKSRKDEGNKNFFKVQNDLRATYPADDLRQNIWYSIFINQIEVRIDGMQSKLIVEVIVICACENKVFAREEIHLNAEEHFGPFKDEISTQTVHKVEVQSDIKEHQYNKTIHSSI